MYIDFTLTTSNATFVIKQEDGTTITTDTYALDTYSITPFDKLGCCSLVVRLIDEPKDTWPPQARYPWDRIIFRNSLSGPFQTENETVEEEA